MIRFLKKIGRSLPVLKDIHRYILDLEAERERLRAEAESLRREKTSTIERLTDEKEDAVAKERAAAAKEVEDLKEERRRNWTWVPPGDVLSPIPNLTELEARESELFAKVPPELPGIEMFPDEQLALLKELKKFWNDAPYKE